MAGWAPPALPARWRLDDRQAFVGRRAEFEKLEGVWSAVSEGARQVVFVGGEPGSGKTRLVAEAARSLHRHGAAVLVGQCLADYGTAYQPFPELIATLRPALDQLPDDSVRGQLRRLLEPGMLPDLGDLPAVDQRRALFDAVVTLVDRAARDRPLVLVLEDLHWAGASSLQLLAHLVGRLPDARLLLLATHRPSSPDRSEPLVRTIADLYRLAGVHRIDLAGLSTDEVTELLTRTARLPVTRTRPYAAMLRDHTGGNPFFLLEMWHDIEVRGGLESLRPGELPVPATVRDTVASRLHTLDDTDREVVELAAVAGDQLDLPLLLSASPRERDATLRAVDRAVVLGLLEPGGDGASYRFPHALARQAVLALLTPGRRAGDHARIATCLEKRFTGATGEVERLAYHFSEAHGHGLHAEARQWLVAASRLAEHSLAYAEVARHLEHAASFAVDAGDRQQLLLSAVDAHASCADFAKALALSGTVATEATDPATRLEAAIRFAEATPYSGGSADRAVSLLTGAIRGLDRPPTDPGYVRAMASLGRALALSGAADEADQAGSRAIALARELGGDGALAHALTASLWNLPDPSTALRQLQRATEAAQLAERLGDLRTLGPASVFRAMYSYLVGDPEPLVQAHAALDRVAGQALPYYSFWAAEVEYGRRFLRGDFAAAQASARAARDLGVRFSGDDTEGVFGLQTYLVRRETGQLDQVRPLVTGDEPPQEHWAPGLLALYTELGLRQPAARTLSWLLADELVCYRRSAPWPAVLVFLTEAALALRDTAALRRLRPMLAEYEGRNLIAGHFAAVFGSADRYLGSVDSALGTGDPDAWFAAAAEMDARMGAVVHQSATMAAYAAYLRRRGGRGDARRAAELAARARELAEPIGQGRVLRLLEPPRARAAGGGPLTAREQEVLRLLAEGRSNRRIAEALVITENTAANHVRSILLKTGAANRTQAVRHASSRGWLPAG